MLNCNIFDTTCLNMSLNITQFNVSAKYDLVILQFNVSKGSDVIVRRSFQKNVCGKSLSTLAMNRKVLQAQTRCQFILSPSWSRRCAQCLLWAKDGKTL